MRPARVVGVRAARRRAVSPVVATVILTSVMLTIVSVALFYSTSLIDLNRQAMEYEYAKEQLTYAATALEQVAFGAGGARYVRFSLVSTRLDVVPSPDEIEVRASGATIFRGRLASLRVCGGPLVTTVPRLLYPEVGSLEAELGRLVVGAGEPMALVYENFSGGACAYLAARLRAFYNSQISVTEGGAPRCYNFFTLHLLNLTRGRLGGVGTVPVVLRNNGTKIVEYRFPGASSVTLAVTQGRRYQEVTLAGPSSCGGRPVDGSVLVVVVAQVTVSTVP